MNTLLINKCRFSPDLDLDQLLEMNSGVERTEIGSENMFAPGSFVPRQDWRCPTGSVLDRWLRAAEDAPISEQVYIFRLDEAPLLEFWDRLEVAELQRSPAFATSSSTHAAQPLIQFITDFALINARECSATLVANRGGLRSTTYSTVAKAFIGLHLDQLHAMDLSDHSSADIRLGINLGNEVRHLVLGQIPASQMGDALGKASYQVARLFARSRDGLTRAFFEKCADLPLMRIALPPGYGYILSTQNVIHDGDATQIHGLDLNLLVRASVSGVHSFN